jgi:glyoxylase-like metal-dependent hydrolase (beta-lactamase superfamily II)
MADAPAFRHELEFEYGVLQPVAPGVRRLVARNPGPFTLHGTGTYVVGEGKVAVIDAGPADPAHVRALREALQGEEIALQLVTHTHIDHSPAARLLREATGARTHGFGPHGTGRLEPGATVEAGADLAFVPDERVADGDVIDGDGFQLRAVHTPGHCSNHLCFELVGSGILFTGDQVMGWSTTVVAPPDGDMAQYVASLERLRQRPDRLYIPTHGPTIDAPQAFVASLIAHRRGRERQVLEQLDRGVERIEVMVPNMYAGLAPALYPAAGLSVLAHLAELVERGWVRCEGTLGVQGRFQRVGA